MPLFRRILLVLLMISLPVSGWASIAMPMCSMQHGQSSAATSAASRSVDSHCCAEQHAEHGSKLFHHAAADHANHGDSQCQCSVLYQAVQPLTASVVPASHPIIQSAPFHSITTVALPLWRPPTLS